MENKAKVTRIETNPDTLIALVADPTNQFNDPYMYSISGRALAGRVAFPVIIEESKKTFSDSLTPGDREYIKRTFPEPLELARAKKIYSEFMKDSEFALEDK